MAPDMNELTARAQAFLFSEGGALTLRKLAQLLEIKESALPEVLSTLKNRLEGTGLTLIETDTEASLVVDKDTSPAIQKAFERELGREIGDAGLEVLAIVLYRGPSTRSQIDYIRGVNTSSTIRNLLARGLVERTGNPEDGREYLYRPTVELLSHLGIRDRSELPDRSEIVAELKAFESRPTEQLSDQETQHV
ncbi:SMC-Scp complex subunit ScpB [Candidatus Kaiserbacteria bacterium]|nr:SMC-Scp complex subunit ScpB [Candidatus Kaiserbacteria bacterium]